jgi:arylsulfatase A-like enzyme
LGGRQRAMAGTNFTAMEASLSAPFIIRWPGKVPAGSVSNEIVHIVDMYPTLARVSGAEVPKDRAIDAWTSWTSSSPTGRACTAPRR